MAIGHSYLAVERSRDYPWLKNAAVVLCASIIIALFAPISIRLPFTPVPIATQAQVILLLAALLGSKRGAMAVLTYLFQGAMGLPVFAGGAAGIWTLAGPTGGYLLGYLLAAFITGFIMERTAARTPSKVFMAMGVGNLVIYAFGLPHLARFVGWPGAFILGMLPFVVGDLFKLIIATKIFKKLPSTQID